MTQVMCRGFWSEHAVTLLIVVCVFLGLDPGIHFKFLLGILFQRLFSTNKNEIYFINYS
jgi:hypothetical protein